MTVYHIMHEQMGAMVVIDAFTDLVDAERAYNIHRLSDPEGHYTLTRVEVIFDTL